MRRLWLIAILGVTVPAAAQARGGFTMGTGGPAGAGKPASPGFHIGFHANPRVLGRGFHRRGFFNSPFFYPGNFFEPDSPAAEPEIVFVQVPQASPTQATPDHTPASPLLIEWQGDRFVRYGAASSDASLGAGRASPSAQDFHLRPQAPGSRVADVHELPPTVLIFRDGRREETANYAIIGGALYEYPDYWTGGPWTKRVQVGELDLPATFRSNEERGVKFVLPAGPNQIVTRP